MIRDDELLNKDLKRCECCFDEKIINLLIFDIELADSMIADLAIAYINRVVLELADTANRRR